MNQTAAQVLPDGLKPAWDIARLFPPQGGWSEEEYLALPGNHLTEFDHGRVEVLERPSESHQLLVAAVYRALMQFVAAERLGTVLCAPFPIKLWEGKLREPDVVFMRREHADRRQANYWLGADLVFEIVSPDDPRRDRETKRREYVMAGIPEYGLVDPAAATVTVFVLPATGGAYDVAGVYAAGGLAESVTLPGFAIAVDGLFGPAV